MKLASSTDALAPVAPLSVRAGTLTNGHTVLMLRALLAGVPSTTPGISSDGRLSMAHVQEVSPCMARAAIEGWKWSVLHPEVRNLYGGKLFGFLSDAKNVSLARPESEAQVLLKVYNTSADVIRRGDPVDWESVALQVLRTKPMCEGTIPVFIKLVPGAGFGSHLGGGKPTRRSPDSTTTHRHFCRAPKEHVELAGRSGQVE